MERQNYIDAIAREYMIEPRLLKEMVLKQLMLGPLPGQGRSTYNSAASGRNSSFGSGSGRGPEGRQGTAAGARSGDRAAFSAGRTGLGAERSAFAGAGAGVVADRPDFAGNASFDPEDDAAPGGSMPDAFYEGYDPGAGYPEDDSFGRPADWTDFPEDPAQYYGVEAEEAADFYEDSETGDRYQAPRVATGRRRGESIREQGVSTSRKLLLNYIARYPAIFPQLSRYVSPEDFGDGLTGRVAELVYRQMESGGKVDEAVILSRFVQPAEQQEIAQIFHTLEPASGTSERKKAVLETLRKVYQAAPAKTEEGSDAMMAAIRKKKTLEEISRLKLSF